jgi:hypothetical protein
MRDGADSFMDRFDHMDDHMSAETKAQIIAESFTGEASVSEVALAVNGGDRILQLCGGKTSTS